MDLMTQKKTIEFIYDIIEKKNSNISFVKYKPEKESFKLFEDSIEPLPRSTPEEQGISSKYLENFYNELKNIDELNVHTIMILRNGNVISEGSFKPYKTNMWHVTHSLCKSITALAIGLLIDDKVLSLNDKLVKIFEKKVNPIIFLKQKDITIKHLLSMTAGVSFNETGAVTENDWVKSFLESNVKFEPGTKFFYNSMNSYMLSAIVKEVTGRGILDILKERIFKYLGINKIYWEKCTKGIEKGGWGLYICPEDMAKLGQLLLQKGNWKGKQLISKKWVEIMTSKKVDTPIENCKYGYGYHVWIAGRKNSYQFNGMLGQNVIVYPDINMVIISTAGNNEFFPNCKFIDLIEKYFVKDFSLKENILPKNNKDYKSLLNIENTLGEKNTNKKLKEKVMNFIKKNKNLEMFKEINKKYYKMEFSAVSILPLFIQALHNNYSKGLSEIGFFIEDNEFFILIKEGNNEYLIPIGFENTKYKELNINEEFYIVGCDGEFTTDEEETLVLKLRISFIETSNTRFLKKFFYKDEILTKWSEIPGMKLIMGGVSSLLSGEGKNLIMNTLVSKTNSEYITYKIKSAIEPEVKGKLKNKGGI